MSPRRVSAGGWSRQGAKASDLPGDALLLALRRGRGLLREHDLRDGEGEHEKGVSYFHGDTTPKMHLG
jgi:hypothetical protein